MHDQGTLRRGTVRSLTGRPAQGRPEALGRHRRPRHRAGDRLRAGEPARLATAGSALEAAGCQLDGFLPGDRTCHLDRGYDSTATRQLLDELGFDGQIARKGVPAPIQAGTRWVVERTHSWMNGYGKLRRCTERNAKIVDFYFYLAAALVAVRQLIQRARKRYRWDTRPSTKRLKCSLVPDRLNRGALDAGGDLVGVLGRCKRRRLADG